jgi:serine/tyrosine/threonine adenylyltransferase
MPLLPAFDNSYARLPGRFYARQAPRPVAKPSLIHINAPLAHELGLDPELLATPEGIEVLAGNRVAPGSEPLAQAYAGHQFGHFVPQLGDGRALLLGELIDRAGRRRDIQLKGSGPTPYSRGGDGRAWVGPVLREYLVSEAMHALGVPTTRALAAVYTGETVQREGPLPGAILTRVAASHLRIGTVQFFFAREDEQSLSVLVEYARQRHYPATEGALGLFRAVIAAQAELVAHWLSLGFVHGVMNTDNTSLSGETIDYGPCAFIDTYRPDTVFSSIDVRGRYAYANQPQVMLWNLAQLGTALLGLIDTRHEAAVERATAELQRFPGLYEAVWLRRMRAKLGLQTEQAGDRDLAQDLLAVMAAGEADFTRTFRGLANGEAQAEFLNPAGYLSWERSWRERLAQEGATPSERHADLAATNPAFIARNHRIEAVIQAALAGDLAPFSRLHRVLARPFADQPDDRDLSLPPAPSEIVHETFCGT